MTYSSELAHLLLEITKFRQIIDEQSQVIAEQKEQIAALLKENQELREKLGTNSSNSSKPPSQDPNRTSRRSKSTGRKPGGQLGHTGHKRTLYPPEKSTKQLR